jgi:hypothetical protein
VASIALNQRAGPVRSSSRATLRSSVEPGTADLHDRMWMVESSQRHSRRHQSYTLLSQLHWRRLILYGVVTYGAYIIFPPSFSLSNGEHEFTGIHRLVVDGQFRMENRIHTTIRPVSNGFYVELLFCRFPPSCSFGKCVCTVAPTEHAHPKRPLHSTRLQSRTTDSCATDRAPHPAQVNCVLYNINRMMITVSTSSIMTTPTSETSQSTVPTSTATTPIETTSIS